MMVNPYDIAGVAEVIHQGLEMNRAERRQRMQQMRRQVMEHNIYGWAAHVLGDLREVRIENPEPAIAQPDGPAAAAASDEHRKLA
jgi:trehalose 6-phosphate synthase